MTLEVNVYGKEVWRAKSRYFLKDNDDLEILDQYNSEIRGLRNYYAIANNSAILNSFGYIMCQSLFKTYGTKYRCSMKKAMDKFRIVLILELSSLQKENQRSDYFIMRDSQEKL